MEILEQIEGRINKAIQTIEDLQARVCELEDQKQQYEEKLSSLLAHLDRFDSPAPESQTEAAVSEPVHSGFNGEQQNTEHHHF